MEHHQPDDGSLKNLGGENEKPVLRTSKLLGLPPYVLDPSALAESFNPFPGLKGNNFRQIDENTLVKYGPSVSLAEAEVMDFVSRQTSVKCPQVIGAYELSGTVYILMSFIDGRSLETFWKDAPENERETVIAHLQRYLSEMRSIKGDCVGAFNRTPCIAGEFEWDFHKTDHKYGPYTDEPGFNEGLVEALTRAGPGLGVEEPESSAYNRWYATQQLVRSLHGHEIVLTHGDLHAGNIMVQDDLTVVILDWNTAGYYPAYWEWYKATWQGTFMPSFIRQVERFIPPYWLEANIVRQIFDLIIG